MDDFGFLMDFSISPASLSLLWILSPHSLSYVLHKLIHFSSHSVIHRIYCPVVNGNKMQSLHTLREPVVCVSSSHCVMSLCPAPALCFINVQHKKCALKISCLRCDELFVVWFNSYTVCVITSRILPHCFSSLLNPCDFFLSLSWWCEPVLHSFLSTHCFTLTFSRFVTQLC